MAAAAPAPRNVYQRLADAKKLVAKASFSKAKGEGLKFAYLPIEQIKPVVEDAINEAGLIIDFGELDTWDVRPAYEKVSQFGDKSWWIHLGGQQTFTWINVDDPQDRFAQTFSGEAKDNSDKCVSKLYTAILKNFYKQTFNISTDRKDDPDNTEDEKAAEDAARRAANARRDPFFSKKVPAEGEKEKEKQTETEQPAKVYADTPVPRKVDPEIATDVELDKMLEIITKSRRDPAVREAVVPILCACGMGANDLASATKLAACPRLKDIYLAVLEARR